MNRREVLIGLVGCGCWALSRVAIAQSFDLPGHCALEASFDLMRLSHRSSSGNKNLDRAMIAELRKVNRVFSIRPGYRYFDDRGSPNALALQRSLVRNTRGTVFFGLGLVQSELQEEFGGAAVAGIAAHEGTHIFQFFSSFIHRLHSTRSVRGMELHADFLAGYYFGMTDRTDQSIDSFGRSLFEKGDYKYNDQNHHGTPDERIEAMHTGYRLASRGASLSEAVEEGIIHVNG